MAIPESRGIRTPNRTRRRAVVTVLLAWCASASMACTPHQHAAQDQALAGIQKLGGTFERDRRADGEPVVKVDLSGRPVADADIESLKALTQLNSLVLRGTKVTDAGMALLKTTGKLRNLDLDDSGVTDAGMAHVSALTSLRGLHLAGTGVTDAGLAKLSPLTKLWVLSLRGTEVTDAGLVHIRALTTLRVLNLERTKVTDAGIAQLRKDLPQARIVVGLGGQAIRRTL
jgi:hypothetical protein